MSKKILIFYPNNPFTKRHGVHSRFLQLLKYFNSRDYEIDMLTHNNRMDDWPEDLDLKRVPYSILRKVIINDFIKSRDKSNHTLKDVVDSLFRWKDRGLPDYAFRDLKKQFSQLAMSEIYDVILIGLIQWANLINEIRELPGKSLVTRGSLTVLTIEDFFTSNLYRWTNGEIDIGKCFNEEIRRINSFDKVICISNDEKKLYERFCTKPEFYYIPHSVGVQVRKELLTGGDKKEYDILFVASNNPFNKEGAIWFFDNVYENISKKYSILIVGNVCQFLEKYREYQNVTSLEFIEDLDEIYNKSRIAVCPLLNGSGLKIKVIEAMSYGLPVVSTERGLTGIEDKINSGIIEANDAESFASSIDMLLSDNKKYFEKSNAAYNYFLNNFEEEKVFEKLDLIFNV